jgi:methionyl-tRNA formyltransferase
MLPELVWNMPRMGTVNLHGSLLPQYRGAAPINWAIINGEKQTGVTTFKLQHAIDTGDVLLSAVIPIGEDETAGELHDKMKTIGAGLLLETVKGLANNTLQERPQVFSADLKHAPKIFTETCAIDWKKTTREVYNLIRGLAPYPAAFSFLNGKKIKVYQAERIGATPTLPPGEYETDQKTYLRFACSDGWIGLKELQLEGKKKMQIGDFLRGYRW